MKFKTTDSVLSCYNGQQIISKRALSESLYDRFEVGPMFVIKLANNKEIEAFEDEIINESYHSSTK